MVGFKNNSFVESKKSFEDPFGCPLLDIQDFPFPLTDSFVDFDPIKEWLEEDPPIGPPPYSMDDILVENDDFGVVEKCIEMGSNEFCVKPSGVEVCCINGGDEKVEYLGLFEQEKGDFGVVEKCKEMGSDQFCVKSSGDFGIVEMCSEMGSNEFCVKPSGVEVCFVDGDAKKVESLAFIKQEKVDCDFVQKCCDDDDKVESFGFIKQEKGDYGIVEKCSEMGSNEFCLKSCVAEVGSVDDDEKVESLGFLKKEKGNEMSVISGEVVVEDYCSSDDGVKLGSSDDLVKESSGIGVVERCIEKGGQEVVEKIESKEGASEEERLSIEEELKRVSISRELNDSDMVDAGGSKLRHLVVGDEAIIDKISNGVKQSAEILNVDGDGGGKEEVVSDKDGSESESETESESESSGSSSSSSSSDTSSDDSDDDKDEGVEDMEPKRKTGITGGVKAEMEEGEIMTSEADEMVAWSDEEDDVDAVKGPIRSKNEVADLPPVPAVNVSILPHHHTLPVGIILSVMGPQVIVEGVEKHNPLSEGSILWITEIRSPLGIVDEIFGPVKNPYYIVRYNSETEVPAGVHEGTKISFVPEFADHVLNNANLYRKGYDASGENDEELSEEAEFSDDEKEAEFKRMQKMNKRGTHDGNGHDRKKDKRKFKNRFGVGKHERSIANQTHDSPNNVSTQHSVQVPGVSSGTQPVFSSGVSPSHPLPQRAVTPGSNATITSSNVWLNGNPAQQTTGNGFPINPQMQGMPWFKGNQPQPVVQPPYQNVVPFQQNMHMNPSFASNFATLAGQPNFGSGQAFTPFPGCVPPNFLNQSLFGICIQENAMNMTNFGPNAVSSSGLQQGVVAQNFLNQSILAMAMQGQNTSTPTNVVAMPQNFLNQSILGMGMQGHNSSTTTNVGANAVLSNEFQTISMGTSNPGQDAFQNFNPGSNRGGGRTYHRGGGRFGGRRGRRPS